MPCVVTGEGGAAEGGWHHPAAESAGVFRAVRRGDHAAVCLDYHDVLYHCRCRTNRLRPLLEYINRCVLPRRARGTIPPDPQLCPTKMVRVCS